MPVRLLHFDISQWYLCYIGLYTSVLTVNKYDHELNKRGQNIKQTCQCLDPRVRQAAATPAWPWWDHAWSVGGWNQGWRRPRLIDEPSKSPVKRLNDGFPAALMGYIQPPILSSAPFLSMNTGRVTLVLTAFVTLNAGRVTLVFTAREVKKHIFLFSSLYFQGLFFQLVFSNQNS